MAVVKMSVTSSVKRCPQGQQQHRPFPTYPITIRGEDVCYIVCKTRGRGFESRPAFHAPVAQWIERFPAGNSRKGSQHRLFPDRVPVHPKPVVKSAVTSHRNVGGSNPPGR